MKYKLEAKGNFKDPDGTIKSVYKSKNGILETTLITNKSGRDSDVYCVPSHNYCNLACVMCHLTDEDSKKPMIKIGSDELIESIIRTGYNGAGRRTDNKNGWLAFMGVGEPLLNLDLLKETFQKENKLKEGLGYKNITYAVSTMMPNRNLEGLAEWTNKNNFPLKVHFSMHSPFTNERLALLPKTKVGILESLELLVNYREKIKNNTAIQNNFEKFHSTNDPIEIHYTLIENENDSDRHLDETAKLLEKYKIPFKILKFNPTGELKRSSREGEWIKELKERLPDLKIRFYDPPGHKVGSSCGEFTKHYYLSELESEKEKQEFKDWKNEFEIFD